MNILDYMIKNLAMDIGKQKNNSLIILEKN